MAGDKGLVISAFHRVGSKYEDVIFTVGIGKQQSQHIFVPLNEQQREALERFYAGEPIPGRRFFAEGSAIVRVTHTECKVQWKNFHPFGIRKGTAPPKKMGIGPLVHHAIIEYLATKHNLESYTVTDDKSTTDERIRYLQLMGIDHCRTYNFPEYREIVKHAVAKRFGKEPKLHLP